MFLLIIWTLSEVRLSLRFGYIILETIGVWLYESEQYDEKKGTDGLFSTYMRTFLKLKQTASGWPAGIQTAEERAKYIKDFYESEGILLEEDQINKNASMRQKCKLFLNSVIYTLQIKNTIQRYSTLINTFFFNEKAVGKAVSI